MPLSSEYPNGPNLEWRRCPGKDEMTWYEAMSLPTDEGWLVPTYWEFAYMMTNAPNPAVDSSKNFWTATRGAYGSAVLIGFGKPTITSMLYAGCRIKHPVWQVRKAQEAQ